MRVREAFRKRVGSFEAELVVGYSQHMLYMVIERFRDADPKPIAERFERKGRMLPDGLTYCASWVDSMGTRYQTMETDRPELLTEWVEHWKDLIEFEILPVLTSADFWAQARPDEKR